MEPLAHQVVPDVMLILFFREDSSWPNCASLRVDSGDLHLSYRFFGWDGYGRLCQKNAPCQGQLLVAPIHTQARVGYCHWCVDKALRRQLMECGTSNVTRRYQECEDSLLAHGKDHQDSADHRCWGPALVAPQRNHLRWTQEVNLGL